MKKLVLLLSVALATVSCREDNVRVQSYNPQVTVQATAPSVGDNLNLEALGELVRSSNSAQEIEEKLNAPNSINNLDLDGDGNVDYIKVSEYGSGSNRGFSFVVPTADNDVIEVAKVEVNPNGQMNVNGNREYYGDNYSHQAHYSVSDMMIMSYLLSSHRPYYSPYHYGSYPSSYRSYRSQPVTTYRTRVTTTTRSSRPASYKSTTSYKSKTKSVATPASARAKQVAAPTSSQKSFKVTSANKSRPVVSGFGTKKSTSSAARPTSTYKRPSSSSSSSSYKSSSSSRRSSSSFGSSSRRSSSSRRR
jgi:hypothetical protein